MKRTRFFSGALAGLTAAGLTVSGAQLLAQNTDLETQRSAAAVDSSRHTGQFVRINGEDFLMSTDGTAHTHRISDRDAVRVTIDGQAARLGDLRPGMTIRVALGEDNELQSVEASGTARDATRPAAGASEENEPLSREQQQLSRFSDSEQPARVPQLGVRLRPSPTQGVFVEEIRRGSAAEQAGIQQGDYILTIEGNQISSPDNLREALTGVGFGKEAEIVVWRDGRRQTLSASFAEEHQAGFRPGDVAGQENARTANDQAWLGVMLADTADENQKGVRIAHAYPSGPAARADLRSGDMIVQVDNRAVNSAEELSEAIREFEAGQTVTFSVRDSESTDEAESELRTVQVRLGRRGDFFDANQFPPGSEQMSNSGFDFRQHIPEHAMMLEQHRHLATQHQRIEQVLYELRDEVQQLRKEIRQLRGEKAQLDASPGDE